MKVLQKSRGDKRVTTKWTKSGHLCYEAESIKFIKIQLSDYFLF